MSATRNLGLGEARGKLVAFIDADDRWRPAKLEQQVQVLESNPHLDAVCGAVNYWRSHAGGKDEVVQTGHVLNKIVQPYEALLKLYPLGKAHAPCPSDLLMRRAKVMEIGGFEAEFVGPLQMYEDQAFLLKFYLAGSVLFDERVWLDYRLHERSCTSVVQRSGLAPHVRRRCLEWFEIYLRSTPHWRRLRIRWALWKATKLALARAVLATTPLGPVVRAGKRALQRVRPLIAPGPAILMYHRIAEEPFDPWGLAISPQNFADQLNWISRHRTPVDLLTFAKLHRQGKLPRNAVAVTFDDGYACVANTAKPLLEKLKIPATIFISPDLIERGQEFWWDELEQLVMEYAGDALRVDEHEIQLGIRTAKDAQWLPGNAPQTDRQRGYKALWEILYPKSPAELEKAMAGLRGQVTSSNNPRETHRPLAPREVREARSNFIQFGSHALSHPSLPRLSSEDREREILSSAAACEKLTGALPRAFAYPYGDHDAKAAQLVEEAGYACACKADGLFVRRNSDAFALPRLFVGNWDAARLARELGRA